MRSAATREYTTVAEVCSVYLKFAQSYYVKDGKSTTTIYGVRVALRFLRQGYGHTPIVDFGPLALKALRETMIAEGHSRRYINDNIDRIRRVFKWAAGEEMLPSSVYQSLKTVPSLRKGRSEARELPPVFEWRFEWRQLNKLKGFWQKTRLKMGGFGSGDWCRLNTKQTVEQSLTLAMKTFRGRIFPLASGTITWRWTSGRVELNGHIQPRSRNSPVSALLSAT
jgi:hypothetical protein